MKLYCLVLTLSVILLAEFSVKAEVGKSLKSSQFKLNSKFEKKSSDKQLEVIAGAAVSTKPANVEKAGSLVQLLIGAGGIYSAFLFYGLYQEAIFHFKTKDGTQFKQTWFLQALEALANTLVGYIGLKVTGGTQGLSQETFAMAGIAQVCAKAFTSSALANGVSFPIVTLAKSGKMVPVMVGALLLGNAKYSLKNYISVLAIVAGTVLVSMGNKKSDGKASSPVGLAFIAASLACDGWNGGLQEKMKVVNKSRGVKAKAYDLMFWTNLYMAATALVVAAFSGELQSGLNFCIKNPAVFKMIGKFAACSAFGQSFIFYTINNFDSLVCTTVTTTRKVFSVLLSIIINGHRLDPVGWAGLGLATAGIVSEIQDKSSHGAPVPSAKKDDKKAK